MEPLYITDHEDKARRLREVLGISADIVVIPLPLMDLPKNRLGIDIQENFAIEVEPVPDIRQREIIKELQSKYGQPPYIFVESSEEGIRLLTQLYDILKLNTEDKHFVCLPNWRLDTIKEFVKLIAELHKGATIESTFLQSLPKTMVEAADTRRVIDRLAGAMTSEYLLNFKRKKRERIPVSMGYAPSCVLAEFAKRSTGLDPMQPHVLRLVNGNEWTAGEITMDDSIPMQHMRPKFYQNLEGAKQAFRILQAKAPEVGIVSQETHLHWETTLPPLTMGKLLSLGLTTLKLEPYEVLRKVEALIYEGHVFFGPLTDVTLGLCLPSMNRYIKDNNLYKWLSKAQVHKLTKHAILQPLTFDMAEIKDELRELMTLIVKYFPQTLRQAFQRRVQYTIYQMEEHFFRAEERMNWDNETTPQIFNQLDRLLKKGESEGIILEFTPLQPVKNTLSAEQYFAQLASYEGATVMVKTLEYLKTSGMLEYEPETEQVKLKPLGYLVGNYLQSAYAFHTSILALQYIDQTIYSLKRGQRDRVYFLHTWYQSFRDTHERALLQLNT